MLRSTLTILTLSLFTISCGSVPSGPGSRGLAMPAADLSASLLDSAPAKTTFTFQMGPFHLPAKTSAANMISKPAGVHFNLEEAVWLTEFEPIIEDRDGVSLPKELVHHIVLVNHGEPNTLCSTKQVGNPFAAATSTMEKITLPAGYGYPILPSDKLEATLILKNPRREDFFGVYIKFKLTGIKADDTKTIKDVVPLMVDIDPCSHGPVSIPPDQFVEKAATASVPESGTIIKGYGLLQNYGVSITMSAGGKIFWDGVAKIDSSHKILGLPIFEDKAGVKVKSGEALNLTVAYDNSSDNWYEDATGAAIIYLARNRDNTTPPIKKAAATTKVTAVSVQSELLFSQEH